MSDSSEKTRGPIKFRDEWVLFDRARNTAVDLVKLVLTLATGSIAALAVAAMGQYPPHLNSQERSAFRFSLAVLVLSVATALVGAAADALAYSNWALAIRNEEYRIGVEGRWSRRHRWSRYLRNSAFLIAVASFLIGIVAAGVLICLLVQDKVPVKVQTLLRIALLPGCSILAGLQGWDPSS